jgi:AbrB family looped-hinge helix DNA binding protein
VVLAKITSKGQITIPKEVRERLGVKPGDSLEFAFEGERLEVRPKKRRSILEFRGVLAGRSTGLSWEEERDLAWRRATERLWTPERDRADGG